MIIRVGSNSRIGVGNGCGQAGSGALAIVVEQPEMPRSQRVNLYSLARGSLVSTNPSVGLNDAAPRNRLVPPVRRDPQRGISPHRPFSQTPVRNSSGSLTRNTTGSLTRVGRPRNCRAAVAMTFR